MSESVHALSPLFLHLLCCLSTLAALPLPLLQRTPVPVSSSACAVVSTGLALPSPVVGIPFSGLRGRRFRVRRRLVPHTPRARLSSRPVRLGLRRLCADAAPLVVGRAPPRPAARPRSQLTPPACSSPGSWGHSLTSARHVNGTFVPYLFGGKDIFDLMEPPQAFESYGQANTSFVRPRTPSFLHRPCSLLHHGSRLPAFFQGRCFNDIYRWQVDLMEVCTPCVLHASVPCRGVANGPRLPALCSLKRSSHGTRRAKGPPLGTSMLLVFWKRTEKVAAWYVPPWGWS